MFRIDDDTITANLVGTTLDAILVQAFQLQFQFEDDTPTGGTQIVCEYRLEVIAPDGMMTSVSISDGAERFAASAPEALFSLIQQRVGSSQIDDGGRDLSVTFENGTCLTFKGDCDQLECYHIYRGDERTIV